MKKLLLPSFLRNFDRKLMLTNPTIWVTRAHFVSWFSFLGVIFLSSIFWVLPNDPRHESTVYLPTFFLVILSIVGIVFYLIYLLRFNVFKRFGNYSRKSMLSSFAFIFISIGWIILFPFIPSLIESYRADRAYTSEELVKDTDRLNFLIGELIYDSLSNEFKRDTLLVSDKLVSQHCDSNQIEVENYFDNGVNFCTQSYFINNFRDYDSLVSLGGGNYILMDVPDYQFLSASKALQNSNNSLSGSNRRKKLYYQIHRSYNVDSLAKWNKQFNLLKNKYASNEYNGFHGEYYNEVGYAYTPSGMSYFDKLNVRSIEAGLSNIIFRKYFWYGDAFEIFSRIWFYTVLGLSLLIFIFRHTTTKVFFLSLLVSVLLMMVSGLITAFLGLDEIGILNMMLLYIAIFFVICLSGFKANKKNRLNGIAINLVTSSIGFVPILVVFLYHAILKERYSDSYYQIYDYSRLGLHLQIAEVLGILLLIAMIPTFIYSFYRKWYSLPDE